MATWCWETANALIEAGEEVCIICSKDIAIEDTNKIRIVRFDLIQKEQKKNTIEKIYSQIIERISIKENIFLLELYKHLIKIGITPKSFVLNQANLVNPKLKIPQYTVAWAYPTTLYGYLSKVGKLTNWKINKSSIYIFLDAIGWYRKDWKGYKESSGVIAVSNKLYNSLLKKEIKAVKIFPCIEIYKKEINQNRNESIQVVISALDLEEPRKRIIWLLNCISKLVNLNMEIHLIGYASDNFKRLHKNFPLRLIFHGKMPRGSVLKTMEGKDIFLFGSNVDDWGYVQTEAMSKGLIVFAPNMSPFDEIIGDPNLLYKIGDINQFNFKFKQILKSNIADNKKLSYERAQQLFSRNQFSQKIRSFISK